MKSIVATAVFALALTTGFTCSKNTPAEAPAPTEAAPAAQEQMAAPATPEGAPAPATEEAPAAPAGETK